MKRVMIGRYKVPLLGENQVYYCKGGFGCGECKPKQSEDYVYRESVSGLITYEEYYEVDVSDCCGGEIGIWDDLLNCDIDFEFDVTEEW